MDRCNEIWTGSSVPILDKLEVLRDPDKVKAYSKGKLGITIGDGDGFQRRYQEDHPTMGGKTVIHTKDIKRLEIDYVEDSSNVCTLNGIRIPFDAAIELRKFAETPKFEVSEIDEGIANNI